MKLLRTCTLFSVLTLALSASGGPLTDDPATGSHGPSQSAVDVLREFASSDISLLAAGLVKATSKKDDLSSLLEYPSDTLVVIELTGAQVRSALERSVSLFPDPNVGFLQVSGVEFSFNPKKLSGQRITVVTVGGAKLDDLKTYSVALPTSLQRGQLGYSKLWEKAKVLRSYEKRSLGEVLRGKRISETSSRVSLSGSQLY